MQQTSQWIIEETGYGRSPVVCVDGESRWWVAWISHNLEKGECVRIAWRTKDEQWSSSERATEYNTAVTSLAIAATDEGAMLAWTDCGTPGEDGLKARSISSRDKSEVRLIVPASRAPSHPTLTCSGRHFALAWSERVVGGRQIVLCQSDSLDGHIEEQTISRTKGYQIRPDAVFSSGRLFVIWQEVFSRRSKIRGCSFTEDIECVPFDIAVQTPGILALPTICAAPDEGCWVAWQSDTDPDLGQGLTRWISVARLGIDGTIEHPESAMIDVDRQAEGEDQGFEAPSLTCLADRRLVIIGRGSQSLRRQDLGTSGWSSRIQVDKPGWQCRGRHFDTCRADEGLIIAGREREGITVRWLPSGDDANAGPPKLMPFSPAETFPVATDINLNKQHIIAGKRILFGDIHQHTSASDGTGTIEETLIRARFRYHDEIVAVADHESFLGKQTPPGEWLEACRVTDEFADPGSFVTLQAFEWTGKMHPGPGHKVVYLPPESGPMLSRDNEQTDTSAGLISNAKRLGALVFPHHVGWTGADMDCHDPEVQTCWEIVSCHGAYERMGFEKISTRGDDKQGQFISDALDRGLRFGFVGGSDGHGLNRHHGICRKLDSHRTGLTAVFSKETTRESVLGALRRRRCYATSGAKIGVWFEIDGRPMGEDLVISGPVPFKVIVAGTDILESAVLVSNKGAEIELETSGKIAEVHGTIPPPPEDSFTYYFVRICQKDGEMAWSSPIWLDPPTPA